MAPMKKLKVKKAYPKDIDEFTEGTCTALLLRRENAIEEYAKFVGRMPADGSRGAHPGNFDTARKTFGTAAILGPATSPDAVAKMAKIHFPDIDLETLRGKVAKEYMQKEVGPTLSEGLKELYKANERGVVKDPVSWLGEYLLKDKPKTGADGAAPKTGIYFVLGGPGSGKGTQCAKLVEAFGFEHFSAGDLLRIEAAKDTDAGKELSALMNEGKIVPSHVTIGLLKDAIEASEIAKAGGAVLVDGFPRKIDQAGEFERIVGGFDGALFFDCPEATLEQRLLGRAEAAGTEARADDNVESIKKRFATFVETSMPVVDYYEAKGAAERIDTTKPVDEVFEVVKDYFLKAGYPLKSSQ